jgi:hypothetical protein
MKRLMMILLIVSFMAMFSACASLPQKMVQLTQEDVENIEALRIAAKNMLITWPMYSGIIKGALGSRMSEMPARTLAAMEELDELAKKTELTDEDLGYSLGVRIPMLTDMIRRTLEIFAPNVLKSLPAAFFLMS